MRPVARGRGDPRVRITLPGMRGVLLRAARPGLRVRAVPEVWRSARGLWGVLRGRPALPSPSPVDPSTSPVVPATSTVVPPTSPVEPLPLPPARRVPIVLSGYPSVERALLFSPNMRTALLALLCTLSTGCVGAAWDKTEVPPPPVAIADGTRWAQYCTYNGAKDLAEVNEFLGRQGERGWQLVALGGQTGTVYCFKAPLTGQRGQ